MNEVYDLAAAKSRFSELLHRAGNGKERFLIRKRGKPLAAIVSSDDLARLEEKHPNNRPAERGFIAFAGLKGDIPDREEIMDAVYSERQEGLVEP